MHPLFLPATLGRRAVVNRLAVAPMTTSQSHPDGRVSEAEAAWLERVARDGYGVILTCAAAISRTSIAFERQMSLGDDALMPGLRALAARLAPLPALPIVQLCHGGSRAIPALTGVPAKSASRYELTGVPGFTAPEAMTPEDIARVVGEFATAARRAADAGFAGIELHGANGYLFTQFISRMTNRRDDAYGGSVENRARFSREVVRACRASVPAGFIVGFRMSFEGHGMETGLDLDENIEIMNRLADDGIDYGHVSHLDLAAPSVKYPDQVALAYIRARVDRRLPIMAAGSVTSRAHAERALSLGADFVAVGRAAIGNTHVPARLQRDEDLARTPFDRGALGAIGVSDDFVGYLTSAPPLASLRIVG